MIDPLPQHQSSNHDFPLLPSLHENALSAYNIKNSLNPLINAPSHNSESYQGHSAISGLIGEPRNINSYNNDNTETPKQLTFESHEGLVYNELAMQSPETEIEKIIMDISVNGSTDTRWQLLISKVREFHFSSKISEHLANQLFDIMLNVLGATETVCLPYYNFINIFNFVFFTTMIYFNFSSRSQ